MNRRGFLLSTIAAAGLAGCVRSEASVVVYTSQDQVFAEPLLQKFTAKTGVQVRPLFDTESVKTAGLANRLRFEKSNPQCDLFWSNEELHTRLLAKEGVFAGGELREIGYRTRRMVINTTQIKPADAPHSYWELRDPKWAGKVVLAYPLYGTTAFHFMALRQHWGDEKWKEWCQGLAANKAKVVDGNSVVVKMVAAGEVPIGLTDWDDIEAGKRNNLPVEGLPLNPESLAMANTLALTGKGKTKSSASKLVDFISSERTLGELAAAGALEGPSMAKVEPRLKMDWNSPLLNFAEASEYLKGVFVR